MIKLALAAAAVLLVPALEAGPPFAKASRGGQSLVVPAHHVSRGTVYHALTGRDRQIYFTSETPLEHIKGQSNRVVGYVVADVAGGTPRGLVGEWHLPVRSMRTGLTNRDRHMAEEQWLWADKHPNIVFELEKTSEVEAVEDKVGTYTMTLIGKMTIRGVTRPITIRGATVVFMEESEKTRKTAQGDLVAIRADFSVGLPEYGVKHELLGKKVAQRLEIQTVLYCSRVRPEDQVEVLAEGE